MARGEANKVYNSFVRGLNTESSPLTFPEAASLDEDNMVLNRDGTRQRRLGMDYENSFQRISTGVTQAAFASYAVSSFNWMNVNDDPELNICVTQVGSSLYFFDLSKDSQTDNALNGGTPVVILSSNSQLYGFTSAVGRLIVATGETNIHIIEYDEDTDTIYATPRELYIRDQFGVDDGAGNTDRPSSLSQEHRYNLLNQGWTSANYNSFKTSEGVYPSNVDLMFLGKKRNDDGDLIFDSEELVNQYFGTSPAPRGKNIINAFSRGASRNTGGTTVAWRRPFTRDRPANISTPERFTSINFAGSLNEDRTDSGPTALASYAGRLFYSGSNSEIIDGDSKSPNLGSYVFFSQVLTNIEKATACYNEADPTSEHISDPVQSDGGILKILGASNVLKLVEMSNALIVFTRTGVWAVYGSEAGFSATNFQVTKITNIGVSSPQSVVVAEEAVYFWGKTGIYRVVADAASGGIISQSVSAATVQTLFNDIDEVVKDNAVGHYDPASNQVRWLYTLDALYDGVTERYKFDKELVLDLTLGAFFKHTISNLSAVEGPYIAGYLETDGVLSTDQTFNVVASGGSVIASSGTQNVAATSTVRSRGARKTKYLTLIGSQSIAYTFTYSYYRDASWLDWFSEDSVGTDAPAFLITGQETMQDTQRNKKVKYITVHMERTETGFTADDIGDLTATNESSCLLQSRWGWANSANSGRWGDEFQAYRLNRHYIPTGATDEFDYGFEVVTTKNKLRGKGAALSLKFSTEPGKDFKMLGWSANFTGEENV